MLKVVGASWFKTKLSSFILLSAILLSIFIYFVADVKRPTFDGPYCATAFWSAKAGFQVEFWGQQNDLESIAKGAARICYKDTIFENGWAQIEIETQPEYPDQKQAYAAGILEGALTWSNIYSHWLNTIQSYCGESEETQAYCSWLREFILTNYESIMGVDKKVRGQSSRDHYWYQVRLFYYQLEGIDIGFRKGVKRSRSDWEIPFSDFLLMNSAADVKDLKMFYDHFFLNKNKKENITEFSDESSENENQEYVFDDVKSRMVLKILPQTDTVKLLIGHSSGGSYSKMLRVLKKYHFHYHFSPDKKSHLVPGNDMVFTSYPGTISSLDDFYLVHGDHIKLAIIGAEMVYNNFKLWAKIDFENTVFLSARIMTANRLAHSGRSWARIMSRHPNTGEKQWLIVDTKRFHHINLESLTNLNLTLPTSATNEDTVSTDETNPKTNEIEDANTSYDETTKTPIKLHKGIIWIVDQVPGRLHGEDETESIFKTGYWYGNGIPHFQETRDINRLTISNESNNRLSPVLFDNITDLESISKFLKQRAYRGDLEKNEEPIAYGNIDLKLYSETNLGEQILEAISGPLFQHETKKSQKLAKLSAANQKSSNYERQMSVREDVSYASNKKLRPFRWSSSSLDADHFGQPDIFNFEKYSPKWAWS